jgi:hypothetical protein
MLGNREEQLPILGDARIRNRLNTIYYAFENAKSALTSIQTSHVEATNQANEQTPQYQQNYYENPMGETYAYTTIATDSNHGSGGHIDDIRKKIDDLVSEAESEAN